MNAQARRRAVPVYEGRLPIIIAGVAAVVLLGSLAIPAASVPVAPTTEANGRLTRVCPTVDAGATVGVTGSASDLAQAPLASETVTPQASGSTFAVGKEPVRVQGPAGSSFWAVTAVGAASGLDQGLSLAACRSARSQQWFTAVRSNADARSELVLVNLDGSEADVDLSVLGPDGAIAVPGGRGIVLAGRAHKVVPLGPLVNATAAVTVEVSTSAGRVVAYVRQRFYSGVAAVGSDWIDPIVEPDDVVVLPSLPAGSGARTLVIGNPSDRTAQVKVDVLGSDGAFSPVGVEQVDVPAGVTREFNLDKALAGKAAALRLTANKAIVAAIEARTPADWATLSATQPAGEKVRATLPLPAGITSSLTVANPTSTTAHVTVAATDAAGKSLASSTAELLGSSSISVDVPASGVLNVAVTSDVPDVRVGVASTGALGSVQGLAVLDLTDAASVVPTVTVRHDPKFG